MESPFSLHTAFILSCHTTFIADASFLKDGNPSQDFLDRLAELLKRDVYLEEFLVDKDKIITEIREASYEPWMEIINAEKY